MFHKRLFIILALAAFVLSLSACRQELDFDEGSLRPGQADASFSSGNLNINFSSASGSVSVDLEATGKWNATFVNDRAKDWCSISAESGKRGKVTITVSVTENLDYDQRNASINFNCGDISRTIVVTQKQKEAVLVSSNRIDVNEEGGKIVIEVRANIPYEYKISEDSKPWILPLETRGLSTSTITFQVLQNEELEKRDGSILFKSEANSETVRIYQDGATPSLIVSSSDVVVPSEGGSFSVEVRHNVSVTPIIAPNCKWIQELRTRAMSTSTFHFSANRNDLRQDRNGWIAFKNDETKMVDTLYVVQPLQTILLSSDTLFFSGRGSYAYFDVGSSNLDEYRVVPEGEWLTINNRESISDKGRFQVTAQPLEEPEESRTGQILVYFKDFSEPDTVHIRQFECFPTFSLTRKGMVITSPDVEGDDLRGFIFWGDGMNEYYSTGLKHTYKDLGPHTVTVETRSPKKVSLTGLADGMKVNFKELRN